MKEDEAEYVINEAASASEPYIRLFRVIAFSWRGSPEISKDFRKVVMWLHHCNDRLPMAEVLSPDGWQGLQRLAEKALYLAPADSLLLASAGYQAKAHHYFNGGLCWLESGTVIPPKNRWTAPLADSVQEGGPFQLILVFWRQTREILVFDCSPEHE